MPARKHTRGKGDGHAGLQAKELKQVAMPSRLKPRKRRELPHQVVQELVDAVRVEKLSHAQAALRFQVTKTLVSRVVKSSGDAGYLPGLRDRADAKAWKLNATKEAA